VLAIAVWTWTLGGIIHLIAIIWATVVGSQKGHGFLGFILGLFLSLIGVLIIYLIGPRQYSRV
jgi:hypothetical protein